MHCSKADICQSYLILQLQLTFFLLRWIVWYFRDLDISYEKTIAKGTSLILTGIVAEGVISEKHTGVSSASVLFLNQRQLKNLLQLFVEHRCRFGLNIFFLSVLSLPELWGYHYSPWAQRRCSSFKTQVPTRYEYFTIVDYFTFAVISSL